MSNKKVTEADQGNEKNTETNPEQGEKVEAPVTPTLTKSEIRQQKTLRLKLCAEAIKQVLDQYECDLVAYPIVNGGKIDAKTELVLK